MKRRFNNFSKTVTGRLTIGHSLLIACLLIIATDCNNVEDVKPTDRNTFIHFYGGLGNFQGVAAEQVSDGYVLVGDSLAANDFGIIVIKTDLFGNQVWRKLIPHGTASSFKVLDDGYLVVGDSIKVDLGAAQVNDIYVKKSRLIYLDLDGKVKPNFDISFGDTAITNNQRVDYAADALAFAGSPADASSIVTINSVRNNNKNTKAMVCAMTLGSSSLDTLWTQTFELIGNRDFVNSRSAHFTPAGKIIWATTATLTSQNATKGYVELPVVEQAATFDNDDKLGENDDLYYSGVDIQPSGTGYGIVGTFQTVTGGGKNICFMRSNYGGNIDPHSIKFFDGVPSDPKDINSINTDKTTSTTDDEGNALAATSDGGFLLAGTSVTSTTRGNGGSDIFLIRVDPFGTVIWNKIIGGIGDESVSTVRQTSDGGFLVCGTLNLSGLRSMYIMKTDSHGNLMN